MTPASLQKGDPVVIVGAGIFGLSTALHLARRGYTNVTVFDRQPYDETLYSYLDGCDAASADINKIVRSAYGTETIYQSLALESIRGWKAWNEELASGRTVPPGMSTVDRLFINNGELSMTDAGQLPRFDRDTIASMDGAGYVDSQLVVGDGRLEELAERRGFGFALDPFRRRELGRPYAGIVDTTGGVAVADKACRFALYKARGLGVRFVLDDVAGSVDSLCYESGSGGRATGVRTRDGRKHAAVLTLLACGGWTPAMLPAMDGLCEATAGTVAMLKIPPGSPLWDRLSPERFPAWTWNMRTGGEGGLYGFPRDGDGWLKIGYRGTKYTNPVVQADGRECSVPTPRLPGGERLVSVPRQALKVITGFLDEYLPELGAEGIGISVTRLCWYTDSFDNHLVIDRVPGTEGLMVATGGSGHAFKYLPCLGSWVVDIIEGVGLDRPGVRAWRWREPGGGEPRNVLMEGSRGTRALGNIDLDTGTSM